MSLQGQVEKESGNSMDGLEPGCDGIESGDSSDSES